MELTLMHYHRALGLGVGVAKPPNWAGSPLEQLLLSRPQGLLLDLIRLQLPHSLEAGSRAGLLSITWVLIWPVIIIRGHIPGSWSQRKAYFCLKLRSYWF